jgi:iron uptake system component EfeO
LLAHSTGRFGILLVVLCVLLGTACGGGSSSEKDSGEVGSSVKAPNAPTVPVNLSDAGCDPSSFSIHPGSVIFSVTNTGSTKVREMEIADTQGHVRGDVEGVGPGQTRTFVVNLEAGTYQVRCPQTAPNIGTLTVE